MTSVYLRKYSWYFVSIALGSLAFLLNINFSRDWVFYRWAFRKISETSWTSLLSHFSFLEEPLYYFSSKFFGEILGFNIFIYLVTVSLLAVKLHFYRKLSPIPSLAIFIYCCMYLFLLEGTVLRVAFATALIIPAIYFLDKKQYLLSIALVLLSTQIHLSAIVFLLIYPLYFLNVIGFVLLCSLFLLAPIAIISGFSVFEHIVDIVGMFREDYAYYARDKFTNNQNSSGLFFYFIAVYYLLIMSSIPLLWKEFQTNSILKCVLGISMMAVIVMCFFHDHVVVAARLGELMLISTPILITFVVRALSKNINTWILTSLIVFGGISFAGLRFIYLY